MLRTYYTPSTGKQANNSESKMPLSNTLPGIGTIPLKNAFEDYSPDSQL